LSPTGTPTATPTPRPVDGPSGPTRRVEASGFTFEVPSGWIELDADEIADGVAGAPELAELAERSGLDPDRLVDMMKGVDLALFDNEGAASGYVDNLNVLPTPGPAPNESMLELGLLQMGAQDVASDRVLTSVGEVLTASYALSIGDRTIHGLAVLAEDDGTVAVITVSAHDAATARELAQLVCDSLESAGPPVL
jgi:hypothetical protein